MRRRSAQHGGTSRAVAVIQRAHRPRGGPEAPRRIVVRLLGRKGEPVQPVRTRARPDRCPSLTPPPRTPGPRDGPGQPDLGCRSGIAQPPSRTTPRFESRRPASEWTLWCRQRRWLVQGGIWLDACEQRQEREEDRHVAVQSGDTTASPGPSAARRTHVRLRVPLFHVKQRRPGDDRNGPAARHRVPWHPRASTPTPLEPSPTDLAKGDWPATTRHAIRRPERSAAQSAARQGSTSSPTSSPASLPKRSHRTRKRSRHPLPSVPTGNGTAQAAASHGTVSRNGRRNA